ncbi:hypothetical protein EDEG_01873 [Edhazardia aedis USNM 41457]|uniref:Uncharacterized protein n=1 Tax=Edhazardia aedis (strain USNM 41457) TaxID=1003232 RepID=J9DR67_EDHAE|nr:hypothetical protein EDEG_01873 [Edhazardia aedis USNM 41457]|eukprot:EJW03837.1 hypothetical protein EDEG_01873 [Edhazardia aedis USNM 41457]
MMILSSIQNYKRLFILTLFAKVYLYTIPLIPSVIFTGIPGHIILDEYTWIKYSQTNQDLYLMLKGDGTVVLSHKGKFKLNDPLQPSASLRQLLDQFIISLEDQEICSNGINQQITACSISGKRLGRFYLLKSKYGFNIMQNVMENVTGNPALGSPYGLDDICLTVSNRIFEDGELIDEWDLVMKPCDNGIHQLFDITFTGVTNELKN